MTRNDDKSTGMDYTAEIEKFYEEFPEHSSKTFIINPDKHSDIVQFFSKNPYLYKKYTEYQSADVMHSNNVSEDDINYYYYNLYLGLDYMDNSYEFGTGANCSSICNGSKLFDHEQEDEFIYLIILSKNQHKKKTHLISSFNEASFQEETSLKMYEKRNFYHETGHAIYNSNNQNSLVSYYKNPKNDPFVYNTEAAAESYALIRLYQDYGVNNPAIQVIVTDRIISRLGNPASPYNFIPALQEVTKLAKSGGLDDLSPKECARLAGKITQEKVLTPEQSKKIKYRLETAYHYINNIDIISDAVPIFKKGIEHVTEPIVLNDAQYILQCLEDITSNDSNMQKSIKQMWEALKENKVIKERGLVKQHFRATKIQAKSK